MRLSDRFDCFAPAMACPADVARALAPRPQPSLSPAPNPAGLNPMIEALVARALRSLERAGGGSGEAIARAAFAGRAAVRVARPPRPGPRSPWAQPAVLPVAPRRGRIGRIAGREDVALLVFGDVDSRARIIERTDDGMVVEAGIAAGIGEPVTVRRREGTALRYFVRWAGEGRIALSCREDGVVADLDQACWWADGTGRVGPGSCAP